MILGKSLLICSQASGSVSKLVAKRSDDSVLVVALAQEILNVWHIFPLEMSQKIGTPNKLIDISSSFQGRIKTLSLPDDNTCVMGAVDENGKLTQVQITHLLRQSVRIFSNPSDNSSGNTLLFGRRALKRTIPCALVRRATRL